MRDEMVIVNNESTGGSSRDIFWSVISKPVWRTC